MKAQSDNRPEPIQSIGRGNYYVNMNVQEVVNSPIEEGGESHVSYTYDYVKTVGYPTYGGVVNLLIRERYTESDELALHRQRDTKPESFSEYNDFCESCKDMARPVFFQEESSEEVSEESDNAVDDGQNDVQNDSQSGEQSNG